MALSRVAFAPMLVVALAALAWCPGRASAQLADDLGDPTGRTPYVPPAPSTVGPGRPTPAPGVGAIPEPPGVPGYTGQQMEPIDATTAMRLRVLDGTFQVLATRGGPDYLGSVLSLLGGAGEIVLGSIFVSEADPPFDLFGPYFITLGGVTIVRTVLVDFVLRPDARGPAIEYAHMPSRTRAEQAARLEYGERQLDALAEQFFIARIVDASLNLAGALAVIPAYLVPKNFEIDNAFEAFVFVGPAIALIGAIVTLASPTAAEQRRDAYHQMRERLEDRESAAVSPSGITFSSGFAIDPRGGGVATLSGTF